MEVRIGEYVLSFDEREVAHEVYDNLPDNHGVVFRVDGHKYDAHWSQIGTRLHVSEDRFCGSSRDLPFHEGTFSFLPRCVSARSG